MFPPHIKRLPDGGGQGGRVQRGPLPAVVQESGGAGPRNLRLLAAFQHRLAINVNTENTGTRRRGHVRCEVTQEAPRLRGTGPGGRGGGKPRDPPSGQICCGRTTIVSVKFPRSPLFLYLRLFLEVCASTSASWIMNSACGFVALLRVEIRYVRKRFVLFHSNLERTHTDQKRQTQTHIHMHLD